MRSTILSIFFILIFVLLSLSGCVSLAEDITPPPGYQSPTAQQSTPTSETPVYPMLSPHPARGESLYIEKCAPCHGDTGLGDGPDAEMLSNPVAPLGDPNLARRAVPADWYLMVTNGNMQNFMPPFNSLSVPERWDVISYVYSLSMTPQEVARGKELFIENCAVCHGERGKGDGPEAGSLSVSPIDFTDQEFMGTRSAANLFQSITDGLGEMHSYADLAEADRWALTSFLRSLTFAEDIPGLTPENALAETSESQEFLDVTPTADDIALAIPIDGDVDTVPGTVTIEIVSVSGDPLPSDMEVELYSFEDMTQVYSKTLVYPADGIATIEDVPMKPEQFIFATTDHQGVVFGSDIAVVEPEMSSIILSIPYYEPTTDLSILKAERLHVFFDFVGDESIQVFVLYIFSNTSNMVLAAENTDEPILTFTLPEGASNLERDTGLDFQDVDLPNGFGLLTVYPSTDQYQILYSFEMPYEKNKVDFDLPIGLDTSAVIVMIPESGLEIKSDRLVDAGMRDIEGISYNMYNGSNLQAGDLLSMQVSGRPKFAAVSGEVALGSQTSTGLVIGLAAFGVMLIGAGIYLWVRNRSKDDDLIDSDAEFSAELPESENPEDLMDAIITLDDLYQSGDIPEDAYLKRRAELKGRLQDLLGN